MSLKGYCNPLVFRERDHTLICLTFEQFFTIFSDRFNLKSRLYIYYYKNTVLNEKTSHSNNNIQLIYHLWLALATLLILSLTTSLFMLFFEPLLDTPANHHSSQPSGLVLILSLTGAILFSYTLLILLTREYFTSQFIPLLKAQYGWGIASSVLGIIVAVLVHFISQSYPPDPGDSNSFSLIQQHGQLAYSILVVVTVVFAPFFEEYLFRGLIFDALRNRFSAFVSISASAVVFMAFHLIEYSDYWVGMSAILLLGFLLGLLRLSSRSILCPIICHASYNACILLLT